MASQIIFRPVNTNPRYTNINFQHEINFQRFIFTLNSSVKLFNFLYSI